MIVNFNWESGEADCTCTRPCLRPQVYALLLGITSLSLLTSPFLILSSHLLVANSIRLEQQELKHEPEQQPPQQLEPKGKLHFSAIAGG